MALVKGAVQINVRQTIERVLGVKRPSIELPMEFQQLFDNGTAAGQANRVLVGQAIITNNATPITIDLSAATITDPMGEPATMAKVCLVVMVNRDPVNGVTVGGGTNPFSAWLAGTTPTQDLPALDGMLLRSNFTAAAWACGAGAQNIRLLANAGTNVKVDYMILGRNA